METGHITPALACVQRNSSAARATWAPGCGSRQGSAWMSRATAPSSSQCQLGSSSTRSTRWPKRSWVTRRGSWRSARRPCAWALAEPAVRPASATRSAAQPPPSRSSASRSGTSSANRSTSSNGTDWLSTSWVPRSVSVDTNGPFYGGEDEGLQAGDERVGVAIAVGERADERLGQRANDRRGRQLVADQAHEQVGVGAAEAQALALHRGIDRLGDQRVGARRRGQRPAHERLHAGREIEALQRVDLALGGAAEHLGEQLALGGEVPVDAAGRDAGRAGDRGHGGAGVAAVGQLVQRGGDDPLPDGRGPRAGGW